MRISLKQLTRFLTGQGISRRRRAIRIPLRRDSGESLESRELLAITVIDNSFNNGMPSNVTLTGSAYHWAANADVVLTPDEYGQLGSMIVASHGYAATTFRAVANVAIGGDATGADGVSLGYGNLSGNSFGELGENGTGVWMTVDTYDTITHGGSANGRVSLWVNGSEVSYVTFTNTSRAKLADGNLKRFELEVFWTGSNYRAWYTHPAFGLQPGYGYVYDIPSGQWNPQSSWRFGMGGRTGGDKDLQRVDYITITDTSNHAPANLSLSNSSVAENQSIGTFVGSLSTTDPDSGNTFSYSLVSGSGSTDNNSFYISGSSLRTNSIFNYESKNSYSVRVRTTDQGGLTFERSFTINVANLNESPTDISLSNTGVAENLASGTSVGSFSTTDPDSGNTYTYSLVSGTGSTDNGNFTIDGSTLKTADVFNFEAKNSYSVRVRTMDQGGLTFDKVFTINVTDINESPTDISLSSSSVAENLPSGTAVGNLSTVDPDAGNTFTYSLVTGTGDADNGSFTIDGNTLKTAAVFNFETKSSYSIRVRSTDQGGLSVENVFTINVLNLTELGGIDVQLGQSQRSYVRYLDILFDRPDDILDMINNGRFQLTKRDLNGLNPVNVPLTPSMFSRVGNSGRIDFGTNGLGGNRNSNVGDGYYQMGIDMDGNGSFESTRSFYRLLGDVNGDRKVDSTDSSLVTSSFGSTSPERDVNGDGFVNSNDRTLVLRAIGRKLKEDLFADD